MSKSTIKGGYFGVLTFREAHERAVSSLRNYRETWNDVIYQKLLDIPVDGEKIGDRHPE